MGNIAKISIILILLTGCETVYYVATQPDGTVVVGKHIRWNDSCYVGDLDTIPDLYNQYRGKDKTIFLIENK